MRVPTTTDLIHHAAVAVVNDLHVGDPQGLAHDSFDRDAEFAELLLETIPGQLGWPATLVLAGDFVDFTQVSPESSSHPFGSQFGATQAESVDKLERVMDGHPGVFATLAEFLDRGGQVILLPGNHDVDFHWPAVLAALRRRLDQSDAARCCFAENGHLYERGLYVEHGHQLTRDNCFRHWPFPVLAAPDGPRLERPWGTLFMEFVYNELPELHPYIYGLLPRLRITGVLARSLLDPDRMSARVLHRLLPFFLRTGISPFGRRLITPSQSAQMARLARSVDADVVVLGHTHQPRSHITLAGAPSRRQRWCNAGSWLAQYAADDSPQHWSHLSLVPRRHDLRFLAIDWSRGRPRARLGPVRCRRFSENVLPAPGTDRPPIPSFAPAS